MLNYVKTRFLTPKRIGFCLSLIKTLPEIIDIKDSINVLNIFWAWDPIPVIWMGA